jgi:DNA-binding NarL/FixJ family response regulator
VALRILLADDFAIVRQGLRTLLESHDGWTVVAEAEDGQEAFDKARELVPDLVIADIGMPRMDGLELTRNLRKSLPGIEVLVVTQHNSRHMMRELIDAGARGYVVKSSVGEDLISAVQAASEHRQFVSGAVEHN